jgi:acetoin utilization protein AcuC
MAAVIYHREYARYDFGADHPFTPARLAILTDLLASLGNPIDAVEPPPATRDEILTVHDEAYVAAVEALDRQIGASDAMAYGLGTPDNPIFPGMDLAARWLVGGTLHGARMIAEGKHNRVLQLGGGLHHAARAKAAGFCLYNDLAVAIQDFVRRGWYVAYLDIDLHHGDGVQSLFYESDHVLTVSLHESGYYLYPGTGHIHELGSGSGRGMKINIPLEPFTEEEDYLEAFDAVVPQALAWFSPSVLVVQAGADGHFADPMGDLALTTRTYHALYERILNLAARHTEGRVLFTLGGGYSSAVVPRVWAMLYLTLMGLPLPERLPEDWMAKWVHALGPRMPLTLHDPDPPFPPFEGKDERRRRNRNTVSRLLDSVSRYWY